MDEQRPPMPSLNYVEEVEQELWRQRRDFRIQEIRNVLLPKAKHDVMLAMDEVRQHSAELRLLEPEKKPPKSFIAKLFGL